MAVNARVVQSDREVFVVPNAEVRVIQSFREVFVQLIPGSELVSFNTEEIQFIQPRMYSAAIMQDMNDGFVYYVRKKFPVIFVVT